MDHKDLDEILKIEETCFKTPWSRKSFENDFKKDFAVLLVAEYSGVIAGYAISWLIVDELHIANLAVHPDFRDRGIGESLIRTLLANSENYSMAGLEVRRSNKTARKLYKKLGFEEVGVRKNYYVEEGEDAILMIKHLHQNT